MVSGLELDKLTVMLLAASRSVSTMNGYNTAKNHLTKFCSLLMIDLWFISTKSGTPEFQSESTKACRFISYLFSQGLRGSTIQSYYNGIRQFL